MSSCTGTICLPESIEHMRQEIRLNPLPVVFNRDQHLAVRRVHDHFDVPSFRRELHSIDQEIPNDLLNALGVAKDLNVLHPEICREIDRF